MTNAEVQGELFAINTLCCPILALQYGLLDCRDRCPQFLAQVYDFVIHVSFTYILMSRC